jgi:hypothetical protein
MVRLALLLFILAVALCSQPTSGLSKLNSALIQLKETRSPSAILTREITDDLMLLADKAHQPSRPAVAAFADALAASLAGKVSSAAGISGLTAPIVEVLQSAGTSTVLFHESIDRASSALMSLGVEPAKVQVAAARLRAIGTEVRGPEDIPVANAK